LREYPEETCMDVAAGLGRGFRAKPHPQACPHSTVSEKNRNREKQKSILPPSSLLKTTEPQEKKTGNEAQRQVVS
jgi:hypothetical protein